MPCRVSGCLASGLFFALLFCLFSGSAFADGYSYEQWNWYISGASNLDFAMGKDTYEPRSERGDSLDTRHVAFGAGFRYGVFVAKGLEIGLGFGYDYDKADAEVPVTDEQGNTIKLRTNTTKTTDLLAGPQIAYFLDLGGIDPFVAVLGGYDWRSEEYVPEKGQSLADTYGGFAYDASIGVNFLINSKVGLSPAFYYTGLILDGTDESTVTDPDTGQESADKADAKLDTYRFGFRVAINLFL